MAPRWCQKDTDHPKCQTITSLSSSCGAPAACLVVARVSQARQKIGFDTSPVDRLHRGPPLLGLGVLRAGCALAGGAWAGSAWAEWLGVLGRSGWVCLGWAFFHPSAGPRLSRTTPQPDDSSTAPQKILFLCLLLVWFPLFLALSWGVLVAPRWCQKDTDHQKCQTIASLASSCGAPAACLVVVGVSQARQKIGFGGLSRGPPSPWTTLAWAGCAPGLVWFGLGVLWAGCAWTGLGVLGLGVLWAGGLFVDGSRLNSH